MGRHRIVRNINLLCAVGNRAIAGGATSKGREQARHAIRKRPESEPAVGAGSGASPGTTAERQPARAGLLRSWPATCKAVRAPAYEHGSFPKRPRAATMRRV